MTVNEYIIKQAAAILCELTAQSLATQGHLPVKSITELLHDVPQQIIQKLKNGQNITEEELNQVKDNTLIGKIYKNYFQAFSRKEGKQPRDFASFFKMMALNCWHGYNKLYFYHIDENFMIGIVVGDVFLCAYMAPKSFPKGLFTLINSMCKYDNVVFAVTSDLESMLRRFNVPELPSNVPCTFRGQKVNKSIFGTTLKTAEAGAKILKYTNLDVEKIIEDGFSEEDIKLIKENPMVTLDMATSINWNELMKKIPKEKINKLMQQYNGNNIQQQQQ